MTGPVNHPYAREGGTAVGTSRSTQGRREVLGMAIGASEAETFCDRVPALAHPAGLCGVQLVISDVKVLNRVLPAAMLTKSH